MTELNGSGEPGSNGSARKVADILREAGISSAGTGGRRRRRDEREEVAVAEPSPPPATRHGATSDIEDREFGEPAFGRDFGLGLDALGMDALGMHTVAEPDYRYQTTGFPESGADDVGGLSSYLLADPVTRDAPPAPALPKRPVNGPPKAAAPIPVPVLPARKVAPPRTDTGPVTAFGWATPGSGGSEDPADAVQPPAEPSTPAVVSASTARTGSASPAATAPAHGNPSASPLASAAPADPDEEGSAFPVRGGVAGWAILAVELLAAWGLGVAAWFAFSALWELLPYVAAFAGPLVVTGLVAVAGALRARTGRNPLGLPTLCILVFAGTVLVVLPAATVIIP